MEYVTGWELAPACEALLFEFLEPPERKLHDYAESSEEGAEIVQLVLQFMGQHRLFHPLMFALAYEHFAGINPPLTRALNEGLATGERLSEAEVRRLYSRYIELRDLELSERLQAELASLVRDTGAIFAVARTKVASYQELLQESIGRLEHAEGPTASPRNGLVSLLQQTQALLDTMHALTIAFEDRAKEATRAR